MDGNGEPGRPTKLTPQIQTQICELIANGNTRRDAAEANGITQRTLQKWLMRGRKRESAEYVHFLHALKKAEAESVTKRVGIIVAAAKENWTAAAWWLERRRPKDWGRKDRHEIEHSGKNGGPIKHEHTLTESEIAAARERLYARLGCRSGGSPANGNGNGDGPLLGGPGNDIDLGGDNA